MMNRAFQLLFVEQDLIEEFNIDQRISQNNSVNQKLINKG